jgi:hypothetical protein
VYTDSGGKGAAGELVTAAYFLTLGYYVYRSQGAHAPFDLVAYKDGVCTRVEVKSVNVCIYEKTGKRMISIGSIRNSEYDLFSVVIDQTVMIFDRGVDIEDVRIEVRRAVAAMPENDHWDRRVSVEGGVPDRYRNRGTRLISGRFVRWDEIAERPKEGDS